MRFTLSRTRIIHEEAEICARSRAEAIEKVQEKYWDGISEGIEGPELEDVRVTA